SDGPKHVALNKATSDIVVTCPASQTFTGAALTVCSATVTGAGGLSQSLTVTYSDNVNVGTATAVASFAGDSSHDGSTGSATFTIVKAGSAVTVSCPASVAFTGSAIDACTASYSGAGGLSGSLTPTYSDNTNVGTAT